jgi:transcription-repair coupling factor (superfamily II helicase)
VSAPRTEKALDPAWIERSPLFTRLRARLGPGHTVAAGNLWGSSQALVVAALAGERAGGLLVLCSTESEAEAFALDLAVCGVTALFLPAREASAFGRAQAEPESLRARLMAAQVLAGPRERRPAVVLAPLLSLLQPLPAPSELERKLFHLQVGAHLDSGALIERLVAAGYARTPLAERPGELSQRGDILDVFPFSSELPLRVELFDQEIESLRTFEPESQRSLESLARATLSLASDAGGVEDGSGVQPLDLFGLETVMVEIEPLRLADQAAGLRLQSSAHARALGELAAGFERRPRLSLQSLPAELAFQTRSVQSLAVGPKEAPGALRELAAGGTRVVLLCATEGERHRFEDLLGRPHERVELALGTLARGFRWEEEGHALVVVNHRELLGLGSARRRVVKERRLPVRALESFFELRPNDLVVHAVHGLARYRGLERLERAGGLEDHLHLEFADGVSLYVPAARIDLVQRYVGSGASAPEVDRLGGQSFRKRKERVERALIDLAAELLEIQARRETKKRPAWRYDPELFADLVRAFPYTDTKDQADADREIEKDLTSPRPMDRLLCGDVGFGKTEVALRAAFRVVSGGGQVAVLVPTTVLARQHFETFRERLADFPVEIGMVSRHVATQETRKTLARLARGEIDVLIGTHRLLSKDVGFKSLGLVIVDEEQRFGVTHKEHFKRLRAEVDVLTLTATPIPRTLHFSLSGARDISALSEPPEGRQAIETIIAWREDEDLIRRALLAEKQRGGQAFFLHNRVYSIEERARDLARIAPECSQAVGHGQMSGKELERVMDSFERGEVDVLVATTIVENGIDIPSAGTILIDEAEHYGLSELHQLRGRVGRGAHQAHCYLLVDRTKPLDEAARARIKALEELTQLGSGFQISMKDLELRGAGNLLGPEQSGHIGAIGYDMYCRLLRQTVERLQHAPTEEGEALRARLAAEVPAAVTEEIEAAAVELELGLSAYLPEDWIPEQKTRLEILRRLNAIESDEDVEEALAMLRDRFGRVPDEARALVVQFRTRALLLAAGIRRLAFRGETYLVEYRDRIALERALAGEVELRPLRAGRAHLALPPAVRTPEAALAWILGLLKGPESAHKMAGPRR